MAAAVSQEQQVTDGEKSTDDEELTVELQFPPLAALLAWLWPGAGHIYQGRYGKGLLFMVCIHCTFFFGLSLGGGHCVYATTRPFTNAVMYSFQLGTGLPAMPALVQSLRVSRDQQALWNGFMAPPRDERELVQWHHRYGAAFDLGILYTMIAGLLNLLAIYDAYGGPHLPPLEGKKEDSGKDDPPNKEGKPPETKSGEKSSDS